MHERKGMGDAKTKKVQDSGAVDLRMLGEGNLAAKNDSPRRDNRTMSLSLCGVPEGQEQLTGQKGRASSPAPPYTHLLRRSGRSPALPYPPSRRADSIMNSNSEKKLFSSDK